MPDEKRRSDAGRLDRVVAEAQRHRTERESGYRERALRMYPWVCGRCARTFDRTTVQELTVHHRDHDHDNNPADGSNWELLCVYCHDNEHQRLLEADATADAAADGRGGAADDVADAATHRPLADLAALLKREQ